MLVLKTNQNAMLNYVCRYIIYIIFQTCRLTVCKIVYVMNNQNTLLMSIKKLVIFAIRYVTHSM